MNKINEPEKSELKFLLTKQIDGFIDNLPDNNNLGFIPDNYLELMTDAAFAVLMAFHSMNIFFDEQDLIK